MDKSQGSDLAVATNESKPGVARGIGCLGTISVLLLLLAAVAAGNVDRARTEIIEDGYQSDVEILESVAEVPSTATAEIRSTLSSEKETSGQAVETTPISTPTVSPTSMPRATAIPSLPPSQTPAAQNELAGFSSTPTVTPVPENAPTIEQTSLGAANPTPGPLPTPVDNLSRTLKVPILMYHYVSNPPEDADKYRRDLSVAPDMFRSQMTYLVENGFEAIDLYDLSRAITNKMRLPEKAVIITLDDGYIDNYTNAFPILKELGLTATFFLATGFIDDGNPNYMTWSMVEEMASAGMRMEPHSKTHPDLRGRERLFIIYEILGSQETIEAHTGEKPRYFAYPGGQYNQEVIAILTELDFWGAVTTLGGKWHGFDDRFLWPRVRIRNNTSMEEFSALVN